MNTEVDNFASVRKFVLAFKLMFLTWFYKYFNIAVTLGTLFCSTMALACQISSEYSCILSVIQNQQLKLLCDTVSSDNIHLQIQMCCRPKVMDDTCVL